MSEEFINVLQQIAINADYLTSYINMELALEDFRDLVKEARDADNHLSMRHLDDN